MQIVNLTVILLGHTAGQPLQVPDRNAFQQFFFNQLDGLAAYWLKQTHNALLLDGQVLEWAWADEAQPNLTDRHEVLAAAVADAENDRQISFTATDVVILVLAAPAGIACDTGPTTVRSAFRTHRGIVGREGEHFDTVVQELGRALGLRYASSELAYKLPTALPGGYAHRYSTQSAADRAALQAPPAKAAVSAGPGSFPLNPRTGTRPRTTATSAAESAVCVCCSQRCSCSPKRFCGCTR